MPHIDKKRDRASIYGVLFTVLTVLLGFVFLLQTASIYFDGLDAKEQARAAVRAQAEAEGWSELKTQTQVAAAAEAVPIYSRAIVGQRLRQLIPYVGVWAVALIGGIIVTILSRPEPVSPQRDPDRMLSDRLRKQRTRLPQSARPGNEAAFHDALNTWQAVRRTERRLAWAIGGVAVVCLTVPFLYFADFSHFPNEDLNGEVVRALLFACPFICVLLAGGILYIYAQHSLLGREAGAARELLRTGQPLPAAPKSARRGRGLLVLRACLLVVGVGLVVLGYCNGSMHEVFQKATKICTECIGLG